MQAEICWALTAPPKECLSGARAVFGLPLVAGPLAKAIDVELGQGAWGLTAFVQEGNGRVLQSLRLAPADCR